MSSYTHSIKLLKKGIILFILFSSVITGYAQKYSFRNYHIEDGLVQSQANAFCQDKNKYVWIATLGGVSCFDGEQFTNYTRNNGLINNVVNSLLCDKKGNVWMGTQTGLSCFNGKDFVNYVFNQSNGQNSVRAIAEDEQGKIWVTAGFHLYTIENNKVVSVTIGSDFKNDSISSIHCDAKGMLHIAVFKKGIYIHKNGSWLKKIVLPLSQPNLFINEIVFSKKYKNRVYLLNRRSILQAENDTAYSIDSKFGKKITETFTSIEEDAEGSLWIGCNKGAYCYDGSVMKQYSLQNGLTDNLVQKVFKDNENNLWFASDGNGIFKYVGNKYVVFDESQGLKNSVIMGFATDKKENIWMATYGSGLIQYDGKSILPIQGMPASLYTQRINCVFSDSKKNIWIGTSGGGLWKFDGTSYIDLSASKASRVSSVNEIIEDRAGLIWIVGPGGCYYYDEILHPISSLKRPITCIYETGQDSLLVGTQEGLFLLRNKRDVSKIKLEAISSASIMSVRKQGNIVYIGTSDRGLIIWEIQKGTTVNYTVNDGLNSDYVYSLFVDGNTIWLGTGRGINRFTYQSNNTTPAISNFGKLVVECNQNAVWKDKDGYIWFGTVKGAIRCNPFLNDIIYPSHIVLRSVKLFTGELETKNKASNPSYYSNIVPGSVLNHNQNHLTFEYKGVSLSDPGAISYQYRLEGSDNSFSAPSRSSFVVYPSLPPGKYVFKVRAIFPDKTVSDNVAEFSFEILAPFYTTTLFKISLILLFVLLGVLIQAYRTKIKESRKRKLDELRMEEQMKVRQKTSEDFHDEMGNKLTRISVLSDILETQMLGEQQEQKKLIAQIKENVAALYAGTKDILWSLQPESDNLYEILNRIKDFGIELFQETNISFSVNGIDEVYNGVRLPIDYSRNILMIFKESLNNSLKHAHPKNLHIDIKKLENGELSIKLTDDGNGFDINTFKKGNGINNIHIRAKRINALLDVDTEQGKGVAITLRIKLVH